MNGYPSNSSIKSLEAFAGLVDSSEGKSWKLLQRVDEFENNFKLVERDGRVPKDNVVAWLPVPLPVTIPEGLPRCAAN